MSAAGIGMAAGALTNMVGGGFLGANKPNTPRNVWESPWLAKYAIQPMAEALPEKFALDKADQAKWRTVWDVSLPQAERNAQAARDLALRTQNEFANYDPLGTFQKILQGTTDAYTGAVLNPTLAASDRARKAASALYGIAPGGYRLNQDALAKQRIYGGAAGVANMNAGADFQRVFDALMRSRAAAQQYAAIPTALMDATTGRLLTPTDIRNQQWMNDTALINALAANARANTAGWEQKPTTTERWGKALQSVGQGLMGASSGGLMGGGGGTGGAGGGISSLMSMFGGAGQPSAAGPNYPQTVPAGTWNGYSAPVFSGNYGYGVPAPSVWGGYSPPPAINSPNYGGSGGWT